MSGHSKWATIKRKKGATDAKRSNMYAKLLRAVFIRAPIVERVGIEVRVLAEHEGHPVVLEQGNLVVASFHPELIGESALHEYVLRKA